ncbi:MAG: peptidylprolyl isomerase [Chloroflexi bacterium]|nr:peptidylprolyl isomerase [Chloroflexota bacterium]
MKRFVWLLIGLLFLVACGAAETAVPPSTPDNEAATAVPPTAVPVTDADADSFLAQASIVREQDWVKGATTPVVTIIEYADFQCPGCAAISPILDSLVEAYPDQVQLVYRHFPLNQIHPNAQKSAEASEAAGAQGAFWEYHDLLFARQGEWSRLDAAAAHDYFIALAAELNLDAARFTQELDDGVYAEYVTASEQEAMQLGLPGTPTGIVNGRIATQLPREISVWQQYINSTAALQTLADRQYDAPPALALEEGAGYFARVRLENGGEFVIELLPESAPLTVNNFVFLANEGWFNGVTFHRVLPGFVAQTGDPTGTGGGGPGYAIPNEIDPALSHDTAGMVAMANSGPDTNGSQWYVTLADVRQLDGGYTIFGRVIEGMDVVQSIAPRDPATNPNAPPGDKIDTVIIETQP